MQRAESIAVLDGGRLVEEGQHEELLAARGAYWALVRQQMGGLQALPSAGEEPRRDAARQRGAEIDGASGQPDVELAGDERFPESEALAGEEAVVEDSPGGPVAVSEGETCPPPRSSRFSVWSSG